jgi:hypothetical protein
MKDQIRSLRPFIGAKDFDLSRKFYLEIGFKEVILEHNLSYFSLERVGFYLQKAFVKDWIDNSMLFLEVENLQEFWEKINKLNLPEKFSNVRLVPIRNLDWGREFFLYDPSGILWHIGAFEN